MKAPPHLRPNYSCPRRNSHWWKHWSGLMYPLALLMELHVQQAQCPNTFPVSPYNPFLSWKTQNQPDDSLDNGILKEGIVTMAVSNHRTSAQYSLLSQLAFPSKLLLYQSQPSMGLSSWMLKRFHSTSSLNSEMIQFCRNTSTISQTPVEPQSWWFTMPPRTHLMFQLQQSLTLVLQYSHDHPLAGHFSQMKTLHKSTYILLVQTPVYVKNYCASLYHLFPCQTVCQKPYGLLKQLLIPEKPWNSISMDFIGEAPSIFQLHLNLVIVDCLSKPVTLHSDSQYHHINLNLHNSSFYTSFQHVSQATSLPIMYWICTHFFQSLTALDMKFHFTSGYHPEGDGQTKWTNQTLEQYLWVYCNYQQDNWSKLLP